jgi:hypothetical protein
LCCPGGCQLLLLLLPLQGPLYICLLRPVGLQTEQQQVPEVVRVVIQSQLQHVGSRPNANHLLHAQLTNSNAGPSKV